MTTETNPSGDDAEALEAGRDSSKSRRTEALAANDGREPVERGGTEHDLRRQKRRIADGDGPPIARSQTVYIRCREPILVTRAGASRRYGAWDAEDGEPVGEAWSLSETAVRGLLRRYAWTRVDGEAIASVVGGRDG